MNKDEVCILIPTLNEGKTIAGLVLEFKTMGYTDILVIDGHSADDTASKPRMPAQEWFCRAEREKDRLSTRHFTCYRINMW